MRFLGTSKCPSCDILDKNTSISNYIQYMFDRTNCMFRYTGLPDTIPEPMFEYMLQRDGSVAIIEWNGSIYAMSAEFGGPPDPYYRPTQCVIANPALGMSDTFRIVNHLPPFDRTLWDEMPKAVRFLNDSQIQGLLPMFSRYATQMAENDISIRCAQINLRNQTVITADSGPEYESAVQYMRNLENGNLSAIAKRPFLEGVKVTNATTGTTNIITQLLELQQYLKASWYNEIGLNSNFNMKSQYVSSEELNSTADIMLPLIDNMFESRKSAVELVNKWFGTNITVEKNSAWEKKQQQADLSIDSQEEEMGLPPSINIPVGVTEEPAQEEPAQEEPAQEEPAQEEPDIMDVEFMDAVHQAAAEAVSAILQSTEISNPSVEVNVIVDSVVDESAIDKQEVIDDDSAEYESTTDD